MGIATLQMKHNISLIYLQNDGFWHQFNPLFHGSPLLSNSSLMKASYHVWMMSKSQKSRKYFIHGSHGEHGFFNVAQKSRKSQKKILFKDYFQDFYLDLHHRLFLSWLSIVKARSHSVFATPKYLAQLLKNPSKLPTPLVSCHGIVRGKKYNYSEISI